MGGNSNTRVVARVPDCDPVIDRQFLSTDESAAPLAAQSVSKADRIKEALGWLKVVFVALVAVDVSLIAWLVQNFETAPRVLLILAFITIVASTAAIIVINRAAYMRIVELEKL